MYLQLKKQNDYLIWIGLGFNTKHYRKLGSSVQTDEWVMYLIYQVHIQCVCVETCGNVTGVKCLLGRECLFKRGVKEQEEVAGERTEQASHFVSFRLALSCVEYNLQLEM